MKNVCLIVYDMSVQGGVEQVTVALASAFCDFCNVHLISLCQGDQIPFNIDERVKYTALSGKEKRLREMQKELVPKLRDYFKENSIDVAVIQGNYPGFIASPVRTKCKTKLVFCDHGALLNQWDRKDIVFIRLLSSELCHKVITLTEQSRNDYIKKFHLSKKKVECITNWIDLDIPHSTQYNADSKKIVSAGRFGKEKGFDCLIEAFAPVAKKHPDWQLDLFGDGEMMPAVREAVEKYQLHNNVNLLGMRDDLAERYKDYAMYVLPSYREGMPLVLLEAKVNRLPIVSYDIMTGPREIITQNVDGILVEPQNTKALGDAMCRLIEDDDLRVSMSEASQKTLDKFSKQTILQQWKTLIENI